MNPVFKRCPMMARYTLTEGDFHHLKKARLTHLHLAPTHAPSMKIHTIAECESTESSVVNINELPGARLPLTIYQVSRSLRDAH